MSEPNRQLIASGLPVILKAMQPYLAFPRELENFVSDTADAFVVHTANASPAAS